jgi:Lon protease-like protein
VVKSVSESGVVPVFPLPDVVFFPGTTLPLHIFEPRYCDMVRDAMEGEGLIVMTLLRPGWERDYLEAPPIYDVATVGRIEDLTQLPDGGFNLRLVGLQRVRLNELQADTPYRLAQMTPFPESDADDRDPDVVRAKLDLLAANGYLLNEISDQYQPSIVLDERTSFVSAVNEACSNLPVEPDVRQRLLEESDLLARQREVSKVNLQVLENLLRIKARGTAIDFMLN